LKMEYSVDGKKHSVLLAEDEEVNFIDKKEGLLLN